MSGIIGKKAGMTSIFTDDGKLIAVTIVEAGPCVVTQVKNTEKDGYDAIQLAFGDKKEKNTPAPLRGHFAKEQTNPVKVIYRLSGITPSIFSVSKR